MPFLSHGEDTRAYLTDGLSSTEREDFIIAFVAFILRVNVRFSSAFPLLHALQAHATHQQGLGLADDHHLGVLLRKPVHPHNLRGRFASGRGFIAKIGLRLPQSNDGGSQITTADLEPEYMDQCTTCGRIKEEVKELVEANEDLKFCRKW